MNGKQAKRLRREVYGNFSQKEERTYQRLPSGQFVVLGLRQQYQQVKKKKGGTSG